MVVLVQLAYGHDLLGIMSWMGILQHGRKRMLPCRLGFDRMLMVTIENYGGPTC